LALLRTAFTILHEVRISCQPFYKLFSTIFADGFS